MTGDITGKGKHKSGFSVDKLQIKPEGGTVGERARRVLEELRRRLGEVERPRMELDYFERLLPRN